MPIWNYLFAHYLISCTLSNAAIKNRESAPFLVIYFKEITLYGIVTEFVGSGSDSLYTWELKNQ